nr:helix-turn-helix transcriptional regulator [Candidatus Protofrankia californiensis]
MGIPLARSDRLTLTDVQRLAAELCPVAVGPDARWFRPSLSNEPAPPKTIHAEWGGMLAVRRAGLPPSLPAAEAGLSRAPFARRFAALVGQPPLSYLTWWRMTIAARLLRESDAPLSVIAGRVGYASEFAFASAFKRHYGAAPGKYRRAE